MVRAGKSLLGACSFSVPPGTALLLQGPNGSGKTTLLKTLAGMLPQRRGSILFKGEIIKNVDKRLFLYIGHESGLYDTLTVQEQMDYFMARHGVVRIGALEILTEIGLESFAHSSIRTLSAGQKRRLALSQLRFNNGASCWLLDEPEAALDKEGRFWLENMFLQGLKQDKTIVYTCHQGPLVESLCLELN